MTFLDAETLSRPADWTPSPDGAWMLYTISHVNWEAGKRQSDLYLVSMRDGVSSTRRMTYTTDKDETSPAWARDGSSFVFSSNRAAPGDKKQSELYWMRPDGGEARKLTETKDGVSDFAFSRDGEWLAYRSGEKGLEQLHRLPIDDLFEAAPEALTDGASGIESWKWAPDSQSIYFTRADSHDSDDAKRRKEGFTVDIKNMETPLVNLWRVSMDPRKTVSLTSDPNISVDSFDISQDGRFVTFTGGSAKRYERNITAARLYADPFLLEVATGHIERLAENYEVGERGLSISPDGRWVMFTAPDDMTRYTMTENRFYVRQVDDRDEPFRKLGESFDGSPRGAFWSEDSSTLLQRWGQSNDPTARARRANG